ncbi:MAG TPA: hypothetical protein VJ972_08220 [Anaerolineales bacterium]|nr:hypothetical protein [Anaerolineales bacterium]
MNITRLELPAKDLKAQKEYYANVLGLPVSGSAVELNIKAGKTELVFRLADPGFDGAYHFAFNIPENQFSAAKNWITKRTHLLSNLEGEDEFASKNWNSHSVYFKDAAGNVLEFIARHNLENAVKGDFDGSQILNISEIGLPSEDVIGFANELCAKFGISVFKQEPSDTFTPIGDDNGLFIIPIKDRIWIPNSGVPAKLLPVKVGVDVNGTQWEVRGYPYEIMPG